MSAVNLTNVVVLDNPTAFTNPFQFEVTFECLQQLEDDLEWKVTYVGSAEDETKDQVLEEVLVGPVPMGVNRFVLQADAADHAKIATEDLLGVTVVLVTCLYRRQEFVRVGYYVNNEVPDMVPLEDGTMPAFNGDVSTVQRSILADRPRITRFPIDWMPLAAGHSENAQMGANTAGMVGSGAGLQGVTAGQVGAAHHPGGGAGMCMDEGAGAAGGGSGMDMEGDSLDGVPPAPPMAAMEPAMGQCGAGAAHPMAAMMMQG